MTYLKIHHYMLCPPDLYNLALCYKMVHFFQLAIWLVGQPVLFHFVIQIIWSTLHRSCWMLLLDLVFSL